MSIKTKGLAELQKMLDTLPAKLERNIMRSALRAGAKVLMEEAKQNASVVSGELRDSIRLSTSARRGKVSASVKTDLFYAKFVEFGTSPHFISISATDTPQRKTRRGMQSYSMKTINQMVKRGSLVIGGHFVGPSVHHPGAKPRPFLRPALDTQASAAVIAVANQVKRRLTKQGLDASDVEVDAE